MQMKTYLFCGVGGSGMSSLAKVVVARGHRIYGSDRNYDRGLFPDHFQSLKDAGITIVPQDGSGVSKNLDALIVSSAVEPSIPDVRVAQDLNVPIIKRAELLAEICNTAHTITVGGTNGKSTVTGMIGHMLHAGGYDPTIINGGGMLNFDRDNAVIGREDRLVVETDESDGSITNFHAGVAVLTNISEDHKDMTELMAIFRQYLSQAKMQVLNVDCPNVAKLAKDFPDAVTYSMSDIPEGLKLIVPGRHNISNALAALAVGRVCHMGDEDIFAALATFKGITSRLEVIGDVNGITVIDDFGHNPDKITASLKTLKETGRRLILMYQPHGFGPTKRQKDDLIRIFSTLLDKNDVFYMSEIYYAGGTADKSISSAEIIRKISENGVNAYFFEGKVQIQDEILKNARSGDVICIMGARDDSLREMARNIFKSL